MTEVIKFNDFRKYAQFNQDFIDSNPLLNYHLGKTITRVLKRQIPLFKFFNIIENNCFLAVLLVENECLIYANDINEEMTLKLSEELEFHKFNRYNFFGTKQIIDALFKIHQVEYSEMKHRITYECTSVTDNFIYAAGEMSMGNINQLPQLSLFNIGFTKEYYGNNQDINKATQIIASGIQNDNIYQWNHNGNICAIAQAIHDEYDFPIIGHVFTNPNFRNKGFAASIVHCLTKGLIEAGNEKCMLAANAYNPASNKAFVKAGYVPTGEYVVRFKEK